MCGEKFSANRFVGKMLEANFQNGHFSEKSEIKHRMLNNGETTAETDNGFVLSTPKFTVFDY